MFEETSQNIADMYLDHFLQHFPLVNAAKNDADD